MCGRPLDDWADIAYVDLLFTFGECGACSSGSWSYSKDEPLFYRGKMPAV